MISSDLMIIDSERSEVLVVIHLLSNANLRVRAVFHENVGSAIFPAFINLL